MSITYIKNSNDCCWELLGNLFVDGAIVVIGTKRVTGYETKYIWKGNPSDKKKGTTGYLNGYLLEYKDNKGESKTYKTGQQPSAWRTNSFGRLMLYEVYKIDEYPTKWA